MSTFSDRLIGIISSRGYQQKKLAADLKLSPARLNNYVKGVSEPNYEILASLCSYLNVTADYLIGVSDSPLPVFTTPSAPPISIQIAEVKRDPFDDLTDEQRVTIEAAISAFRAANAAKSKEA